MTNWTTTDIPDQTGRTAVITGANTGLGYETAAALAAKGAHVVLAVRNVDKGKDAAARITDGHPGAERRGAGARPHLAGVGPHRRRTAAVQARHHRPADQQRRRDVHTEVDDQGRLRIAVRHKPSGPLRADRPAARPPAAGAGSRVVTVSSVGHRFARNGIRFDDLQWEQDYSRVGAYGQAKLANLMFTYELQRRLQGTNTIAAAAHPGGSRTELTRNLPPLVAAVTKLAEPLFQGADMGALPTLRAATDPGVIGGQYFGPDGFGEQRGYPKVVASSRASHDVAAQRRLWTVSEELTGVTFSVPAMV